MKQLYALCQRYGLENTAKMEMFINRPSAQSIVVDEAQV